MGGYGSVHIALSFPERFSGCVALSSAFTVKILDERLQAEGLAGNDSSKKQPKSPAGTDIDPVNDVLPFKMVQEIFGGYGKLTGSDIDPEAQYLKLKKEGKAIPKLYIAVGTEDSLLDVNRDFAAFLKKEGAEYKYEEGPGKHDWFFWNEYVERGLKYVLK